ncbi:DNA excision repair protein ERCC-5 [Planococcus citri]|uniref:DNA excision repair protein ERCC-5 n=1 Tax=Planococcus citri TaxID=170843 RepID=UPI0031F7B96E
MGVHGLWKLIEPAGKQVPLESLENKVLAVDVSIWLYQLTKGLQTTGGGAIPNAHLLGLFNRICKLLYYRIKPVFVFDGGVPFLKKETIEARKRSKRKAQDNSEQLREKLLKNYLKQKAVRDILGSDDVSTSTQIFDDMFALPPLPEEEETIDDPDSDSDTEVATAKVESFCDFQYGKDLHSIDIQSEQFKALPPEIRHEILSELIETKKQNSWAKVHEMPEDSQDFSKFQLERLKKRRDVQLSLDTAAKEMGGRSMTLNELEAMFKEDGIVTDNLSGQRIVGDNVTRYLYVTGKTKEKAPVINKPKLRERNETSISIRQQRAEIEKVFEISAPTPAPSKSSPINEMKFHERIQTIEDSIFIKDSSSEDEIEVINDTADGEYIRSLLDKEKLSQEEILKIIKQEQNEDENSSPSFVTSDTEDKPMPRTMVVSAEVYDEDIVEPSQEFEPSRLSFLLDQSAKVTIDSINLAKRNDIEGKPLPSKNVVSESHSIELFLDDEEMKEDFNEESRHVSQLEELPQTVLLPKDGNEDVSKARSLELFSDTDSDDFIEVNNDEKSSYFKNDDKQIEISINPNNVIEHDIFSDVFKTQSVKDTQIPDNNLNDTVILGNNLNDTVIIDGNLNDTVIIDRALNDTVIIDRALNDTVILDRNLNDTLFFDGSQPDEFESFGAREISSLSMEEVTQRNTATDENIESTGTNEKTKETESVKSLASILNKVKKAEKTVDKSTTETKTDSSSKGNASKRELTKEIQEMLSKEETELLAEKGKQERLGSTITQQMIVEAQELLQLFGLPYVVAPMEAEAQCAFLDKISLTEGTITDDSDIWLFGGQKVYKNFFDHKKYVLQFRAIDIEHFFKLSREQLIQMALLVGSDYTVGIESIGPVTAIEILAYFSDSLNKPKSTDDIAETLRKFRNWLKTNRNKGFSLSRKCKDVNLSEAFPNTTVIDAYLYPTVDKSEENFTWATPDLDRIRAYMHSKFGWKISRIDDVLLPVMKRLNDRNKQSTLDMYFKQRPTSSIEFSSVSKRVIQAINVMKSKNDEQPLQAPSTSKSPRKIPPKTPPKRTRRNVKKTPLKRTPVALPVQRSSPNSAARNMNSASRNIAAPYFGETIPQKEKDKMEAAKRKMDAIKIFQAQNKSNRSKGSKKKKVLPPKPDSSYLSESSSGDDL